MCRHSTGTINATQLNWRCSDSTYSGLPSWILNLYWIKWALAFVCFSFFVIFFLATCVRLSWSLSFWVHVKLFFCIISYRIGKKHVNTTHMDIIDPAYIFLSDRCWMSNRNESVVQRNRIKQRHNNGNLFKQKWVFSVLGKVRIPRYSRQASTISSCN